MQERSQDKIKRILFEHPEIKECEVAWAVGLSPQTLNYQLNNAIKFDVELEENIYNYFKKKGIIKYQSGQCTMVNDLFLEFGSIHSQHYSMLSNEIRQAIKDNSLSDEEAERLLLKIKNLRINDNTNLDYLEDMVKGNLRK